MNGKPDDSNAVSPWRQLWQGEIGLYCLLINLGFGLHAIDTFLVSTIMPDVIAEIGGAAFYSWTSMLYMLASILGGAAAAPLAHRFGGKRAYEIGILAFLLGSLLCALGPQMPVLLLGRLVQGFGGGIFVSRGMAMIGELFPHHLKKPILALVSSTWGIAALVGPALGGLFAEIGFWRGAFWINMPLAFLFLFLARRHLPARRPPAQESGALAPFPFAQLGLFSLGLIALGSSGEWRQAWQSLLAILMAGSMLAAAFALDAVASHRLFPRRPLAISTTTGAAYWVMFLSSVTHTMIGAFLPLAMQRLYGLDALAAGYATAALALGWTGAAVFSAKWQGRLADAAMIGGHGLAALGLFGLGFGLGRMPVEFLVLGNFAIGLGIGASNLHLVAAAMRFAPVAESAITASAMPPIRSLGIAFGAAGAGAIATMAGLDDRLAAADVARAMSWIFGIGLLAPLGAFALSRRFVELARRRENESNADQKPT